jgi:hypothetical protein
MTDFSFQSRQETFDKDAQGAHITEVSFLHRDARFTHHIRQYDAYQNEWSENVRKGHITAVFPEKGLVKLCYDNGHEAFLNTATQQIDDRSAALTLHFYHPHFFPTQAADLNALTDLFAALVSAEEGRSIAFEPPVFSEGRWQYTPTGHSNHWRVWLAEDNTDYPRLEMTLSGSVAAYDVRVGAYRSNLYVSILSPDQPKEVFQAVLQAFVERHPPFFV